MGDVTGLWDDVVASRDVDLEWLKACLLEDSEFIKKLIKVIEKEKLRQEMAVEHD